MREILTAAQMRAIEQAAIESGVVTGQELMERAGRGVVEAVFEAWPDLAKAPQKAVVLCGPGNNGGDGFVVARLLKGRGWEVELFLYGDPAKLPPDARLNYERWLELGEVAPVTASLELPARNCALVVDALFGTGLTRPVQGLGRVLLDLCDSRGLARHMGEGLDRTPVIVAVDLPTGLCSDSGRVLMSDGFEGLPDRSDAASVQSDLTVSFHRLKLGHMLQDGPSVCGKVVVKDIGLSHRARPEVVTAVTSQEMHRVAKREGHKYAHGHALILTGGAGKTGAARLAARGALRIGSGLVTLGVPGSAQHEVACQVTALMLRRIDDAAGLAEVLADKRVSALCLGPGLGVTQARELVPVALGGSEPRPAVLDADALTAFEDAPETLFSMLHDDCVLTPHAGEFARLFPDIAARLTTTATGGPAFSKVDATRAAAQRAGCVVLFKGADTVIASPDGRCALQAAHYDRAAPWLATAGSGDVLAGFITGLLARGLSPMPATELASWLHVESARLFGPGLVAEDLPEALPGVMRDLGL